MAKLIVRRPQVGRFGYVWRNFRIVIDGRGAASIGAGRIVEIELAPGPHQVTARIDFLGSQTVHIDAGPEETHYLAVSHNPRYHKLFSLSMMLACLPQIGIILWMPFFLMHRPGVGFISGVWLIAPILIVALPLLVQLPVLVLWRNHCLDLTEIPGLDLTPQRIAELRQPQPLRVRITIRGMMIAVAILAVLLGAGIEGARMMSRSLFRIRADYHARMVEIFQDTERKRLQLAVDWEKRGADASIFRRSAAKDAAVVKYHAAMRAKYEDAAARRAFTVEPDPPPPTWP